MEDDPFDCFGDDSDQGSDTGVDETDPLGGDKRPPDCGVLTFHHGTEEALLVHVRNILSTAAMSPTAVMGAIDEFCLHRHWMMHVGPEKSRVLRSFLKDCVEATSGKVNEFVVLELGTYCGYSSIVWADTLLNLGVKFHIYTVEMNPRFIQVARALIALSGLESAITVLPRAPHQDLSTLLKTNNLASLNFLFLDHDKGSYLEDLRNLETNGFALAGLHVAADNVVFAEIDDYRSYIETLVRSGVAQTELVRVALEYSQEEKLNAPNPSVYDDAIELSRYLVDSAG